MASPNQNTKLQVTTDLVTEPAPDRDFEKAVREESFFNEPVTIEIATTTDENAPPHVIVSVNGVSQPIARGVPTTVKRKYVEVLARCWETKYKQPDRDMANPEAGNGLYGRSALTYPFQVLEDKNPVGHAWLRKIMSEPQ